MSNPDLIKQKVSEWKVTRHSLLKVRGFIDAELRDLDHNIRVWESEDGKTA